MAIGDDSHLQGNTCEACFHNIESTIELLQNLGFTIQPTKSILTPTQIMTFLGFLIDSVQMTLELTVVKKIISQSIICLENPQKEKFLYAHQLVLLAIFLLASLRPFWDHFFIEICNIKK